jgi:hypothetical protein
MRIVIDLFEKIPEMWELCNPAEKEMFTTIKKYFYQRFATLRNRINKEEQRNKDAKVLIRLLDPSPKDKILIIGYSNDLLDKMQSCLTEQDLDYLNKLLIEKWQSHHN